MGLYVECLPREDFREQPQLEGLLQTLRRSLAVPFQRLPAVAALFLAESALQLQHPGGPMYVLLNKLLLKRPAFNLEVGYRLHRIRLQGLQISKSPMPRIVLTVIRSAN